jgi:L-histidine N-alpha-methyltransferase
VTAPSVLRLDGIVDRRREMAEEVRAGLARRPRELPCRYFYDARGSALFEEITRLPEYYPTRAEAAILEARATEIVALTRPEAIVELGAGSCAKTRLLIEVGLGDCLRSFVPFDISPAAVEDAVHDLASGFDGLEVSGIVGDFRGQLGTIPRRGRQLVLFLGSTIGNFEGAERDEFLSAVRGLLRPGDHFLLGVDLVKDRSALHAAYNDSRGVTAEFNLNLLRVLNRELGADFDLDAYEHVAFYAEDRQRIEMHLRVRGAQKVRIPGAGLTVELEPGEQVRTEISAKFTRDSAAAALEAAGMRLRRWFTDPAAQFGLALAEPA